jgi:hypothetical protein
MKRKNDMKLSEAFSFWFKSSGIEKKIIEKEVSEKWNLLFGESIANQTRKIELKQNCLIIYLTSSLIKHDFNLRKDKIIHALNETLTRITIVDIEFRV